MTEITNELKKSFLKSYNGLTSLIDYCPDELWSKKCGGYLFAQQILHAVTCCVYYLRYEGDKEELNEPIIARIDQLHPGLEETAKEVLSKQELLELTEKFRTVIDSFFELLEHRINEKSSVLKKQTNLSVVLMEIRHLSYHAGHLDSVLREKGLKSPGWGYMS